MSQDMGDIIEAMNGLTASRLSAEDRINWTIIQAAINELELLRDVAQAAHELDAYEDFGEQMARPWHCGEIGITVEHQVKRRALYEALFKTVRRQP